MKRNILFALVAMALGGVGVAQAQDYSGVWYVAPRIGYIEPDSSRTTKGDVYGGIGVGAWVNLNFAVDFGTTTTTNSRAARRATATSGKSVQLDVAGRWFFGDIVRAGACTSWAAWAPLRHKAYSGFLLHENGHAESGGWDPMVTAGFGIQVRDVRSPGVPRRNRGAL